MALHRDIFWVGRQWAVTGHGLQAVDQKQKSKFDIEICRLWEDDLTDGLAAERWFNAEDFSKGLSIARARYPAPGETADIQPPRSFKPEPIRESAPPREPLSPPRQIAAVASSRPVPEADPPPKPDVIKPGLAKSGAASALSEDTWASLAELAKSAKPAPLRKVSPPARVAPPKPSVFTAPAKPLPRFDSPQPAVAMVEPLKRACLPFDMRIESSGAKFSRMWRVRIHR